MKNHAEGDVLALFEEQQTLEVTWTSKRDKNDIAMGKSRSFSVCSASIDHSTCAPIGYPGLAGHEENVVKSSLFLIPFFGRRCFFLATEWRQAWKRPIFRETTTADVAATVHSTAVLVQ